MSSHVTLLFKMFLRLLKPVEESPALSMWLQTLWWKPRHSGQPHFVSLLAFTLVLLTHWIPSQVRVLVLLTFTTSISAFSFCKIILKRFLPLTWRWAGGLIPALGVALYEYTVLDLSAQVRELWIPCLQCLCPSNFIEKLTHNRDRTS